MRKTVHARSRALAWTGVILGALLVAPGCVEGRDHGPARALATPTQGLEGGLARTPPMGWNSWNRFGCDIDERLIREMADAMVESGLRDAGYQYLNIDDCWQKSRDKNGNIVADPSTFPGGIRALSDYLHARGLKLGLYSDHGLKTCQGRPGSYGYESQDASRYAAWGADYLKYDNCFIAPGSHQQQDYERMRDALATTGRDIVFSLCAWGFQGWMPAAGHLWRTTGDISDSWDSMIQIADTNADLAAFARPGAWNDPDMLEVGNGGMSDSEYRAHMSLWAIMAAPLIAGNDLRSMSESTRQILGNPEVIAVDQDPLGKQGVKLQAEGALQVFARELSGSGERAVVLLNRGNAEVEMKVRFGDLGLSSSRARVRDLWAGEERGVYEHGYATRVAAHGAVMLKVWGDPTEAPKGSAYLSDLAWKTPPANGWGPVERDRSNGEKDSGDGRPLSVDGVVYPKGLGVHARSEVRYALGSRCARFSAVIGLDDEAGDRGGVIFRVLGDGEVIYESGVVTGKTPAKKLDLDLTGTDELGLQVIESNGDFGYAHADWADARITCTP